MSNGSIGWVDLTTEHADRVRDFYGDVAGWESSGVDMGGYEDYCMHPPGGEPLAGICHARGTNEGMPAQWLIYITVDDIERSAERCTELGGEVVTPIKGAPGKDRSCVIRDPAGALAALYQPAG